MYGKTWERILGRLQRNHQMAQSNKTRQSTPNAYSHLPEGTDVHPAMDRDDYDVPVPTDPSVYDRPHSSMIAHLPRDDQGRFINTGHPSPSRIREAIRELINNFDPTEPEHELDTIDELSPTPTVIAAAGAEPPSEYDYVPMSPAKPVRVIQSASTSAHEQPSTSREESASCSSRALPPTPRTSLTPEKGQLYENTRKGEHLTRPIPQGSPELHASPVVPSYYSSYLNPRAVYAYSFICHSTWNVQIGNIMSLCPQCASAEHSFCTTESPRTVWRHIHLISRDFRYTDMHCGRCYKLLIQTRRAIDCEACREYVIKNHRRIVNLEYLVLCDNIVPDPRL